MTPEAPPRAQEPRVVGEARWPMAFAVVAVIVLTILLPHDLVTHPRWGVPFIEGILLVAVDHRGPGQDRPGRAAGTRALDHLDRAAGGHDALVHDAAHRRAHPRRRGDAVGRRAARRRRHRSGSPTASRSACSTGNWTAAGRRCARTVCRPTRTSPSRSNSTGAGAGALAAALRRLHVPRFSRRRRPSARPTRCPLKPWNKLAMMAQSTISLALLGLVIARAVNVLT